MKRVLFLSILLLSATLSFSTRSQVRPSPLPIAKLGSQNLSKLSPRDRALKVVWPVTQSTQPSDGLDTAKKLFETAVELFRARKLDEALRSIREADKLEPNRYEIQLMIGVILTEMDQPEQALLYFKNASKLAPKNANVSFALCNALALADLKGDAIDHCKEAVQLAPQNLNFRIYLANLYAVQGQIDLARQLLASLDKTSNDELIYLGTIGDLYFQSGDYSMAADAYKRITAKWPDTATAHLRLSAVYDYLDNASESVAAAKKYAELKPTYAYAQYNLGKIYLTFGFIDESLEPFKKTIQADAAFGSAYDGLSEAYDTMGDKESSLLSLGSAYRLLPPDFYLSYRFGIALIGYGQMAEAVEPLEKANSLDPQHVGAMISLGLACFESNKFDKALEILTKADLARPNDSVIAMYLRVTNARKKGLANFEQVLAAVKKDPLDMDALSDLAHIYRYKGMYAEAEREHLKLVKNLPNEASLVSQLAIFYSDTGQHEKSLQFLRRAAEIKPNHVSFVLVSTMLAKLGRLDEAIEVCAKAIEFKPDSSFVRVEMGNLMEKKGRRADAIREYQAAFDSAPGELAPNLRLAWLFLRTGNRDGALRHYGFLKNIVPNELGLLQRSLKARFGSL